jgi:DNA invertase Pin-like site-specific DNA recombinase
MNRGEGPIGCGADLPVAPDPCLSGRFAKIHPRHRERLALVYVRQSSPHQVLEHVESRERQYALPGHAAALGWPDERILVIDEDQGCSARSADGRSGFQRLLAEVTMDHVGMVLGLEMSRLARSNKDWHHLIEVCAVFGTLLADQDGVYDPNDPNDRLLLGLKGAMSEAELFTMRNRLERGRLHKAQRGELFPGKAAVGYVVGPDGRLEFDPDEQVQSVVRLVFAQFEELGSAWAVYRYLVRHDLRLGFRLGGARRGHLEWRRPSPSAVRALLQHPVYAGVYTYGRRPVDNRRPRPAGGRARQRRVPWEQCKVLKRDQVPGYISWERFLENQQRMQQNRSTTATGGGPRPGGALLTGLVVCGTCGYRLHTSYGGPTKAHYHCVRHLVRGTGPACAGLRAAVVDELVVAEVLRAVEPAALELSLQAVADLEAERARLDQHWRQRLERARYEASRAERQYQAVDPENRLVARTLEKSWEEALRAEARLQEEYDRWLGQQPLRVGPEERAQIQALAEDLPALWHAETTTMGQRKEVLRCLLERVVVQVRHDSEAVGVTIHWQGGYVSEHRAVRPVLRYEQLAGFDQLLARLAALRSQGLSSAAIAEALNAEGYRTPKLRKEFNATLVRKLVGRRRLARGLPAAEKLETNEWWAADLAEHLGVTTEKVRHWIGCGWLHGRQTPERRLWVAWADRQELRRLKKLAAVSRRGATTHPQELTRPRKRKSP